MRKVNTQEKDVVTKSNAIARARWPVASVLEPRLVALVASKVSETDEAFQTYSIHIAELFGTHYGTKDLADLERVVHNIMNYMIEFEDAKMWIKTHIFSMCAFDKEKNILSVRFDDVLRPHYLQLKNYFIQYKLSDFLTLGSTYSQRMYEYIKSWANCDYREEYLEELHKILGCEEYLQKDFAQFRLRVLEKSKKDLKKVGLEFDWKSLKSKGRKVEKILFIFVIKDADKAPINREHWHKMREKSRERTARLRLQATTCFMVHGDTCVGCHEKDSEQCSICLADRRRPAKQGQLL